MPTTHPPLEQSIRHTIELHGPLPFEIFLQLALYHPQLGYYARTTHQVGKMGDFYTSVSVGPLFGTLLATRFLTWWQENGCPSPWRILELGAHDGKLAADILTTLREISPTAWTALEYAISEPLPHLHTAQSTLLTTLAKTLNLAPSLSAIATTPLPGIAFGNEILDALPFHLIELSSGKWQQLHVTTASTPDTLSLTSLPPSPALASQLTALPTTLPQPYRTELRTSFPPLLSAISACLTDGLLLFVDYGFAAPEYYHPQRTTGTLRTFSHHTAAEDPLATPGEIDITAHVDFTALAHAAAPLGYLPTTFSTQGTYLTHLAQPLLLAGTLHSQPHIAQFQTLTHPAHLGMKFHAIEFQKNHPTPPTVAHRLAL